jgi:cardiolipin synthase (CMP-forming)
LIPPSLDRPVRQAAVVSLAGAAVAALIGAAWLSATGIASDPPVSNFVVPTLLGGVASALLALGMKKTFRRPGEADGRPGESLERLGVPNGLTLVRFVLIAPTVIFLLQRRYPEALVVYAVLFTTDVADGVIARRRGLESEFGVIADPLADIASTFAVFSVLFVQGLFPGWVYAILIIRYLTLGVGSLLIRVLATPFTFKATLPGKIVGVVQAAAACLIFVGAMAGGLGPRTERVLFAFLGIGFASIVASQAVIGWRLVRRRVSPSGSSR